MARAHLVHRVASAAGDAIANAVVHVYQKGTTTDVSDLYAAESGGSAVSPAVLTSDSQGYIEGFLDTAKPVDLKVTDNADAAYLALTPVSAITFTDFTETRDVYPPADEVAQLDTAQTWTATQTLPTADITTARFRTRPWVDVTHAIYGATGDGTTDDTAAVQSAITAAIAAEVPVFFPPGTYLVENLAVPICDQVTVIGAGPKVSVLKMRADDGGGGTGQLLVLTDVTNFVLRDIGIHGNYDDSKAGTTQRPLVYFVTTVATNGQKDFSVDVDNVEFTESAGGYGQMRVAIYENNTSTFSEFATIRFNNVRSTAHGTLGPVLQVRGPGGVVEVNNLDVRNDGLKGMQTYGDAVAGQGSGSKPVGLSCEISYGHYIRVLRGSGWRMYRTYGSLFTQMVKTVSVDGVDHYEDSTNPSFDQVASTATVDAGTDVVTATVPSGFGNSSIVKFTTTGVAPAGLTANQHYFVRDTSGGTFKLAATSGGAAIDITDTGSGTHSVQFLGYTFTTGIKGDDNLSDSSDPSVHTFRNVRFVRSSPHTANTNMSYEESNTDTMGSLRLQDCYFNRPVSAVKGYATARHRMHSCTMALGWLSTIDFGNSSSITGSYDIEDCNIPNAPTFSVQRDMTIRNSRFAKAATFAFTDPAVLRLIDNTFNTDDTADAILTIGNPSAGEDVTVELRGNRRPPAATYYTKLRVATTGTIADQHIISVGNDFTTDTGGSSDALSTSLDWTGHNNRNGHRSSARVPTTLADSATPSIVGNDFFVTGGATQITNFADGVNNDVIEVSILTGHQVNNTATIVAQSGANIAGPAVRRFRRAGGIWYEA